jgi:hypothetical protein
VPWTVAAEVDASAFIQRLERLADMEIPARREAEPTLDFPEDCWALLQRCLAPEQKRATATEAAENAWVKEFIFPHALTVEELFSRRHNPYVGTFFSPASPTLFPDPDGPRSVAQTRQQRRRSFRWMDAEERDAVGRVDETGQHAADIWEDLTPMTTARTSRETVTLVEGDLSSQRSDGDTPSTSTDEGPFVSRPRAQMNSRPRSMTFPVTVANLMKPALPLENPSRSSRSFNTVTQAMCDKLVDTNDRTASAAA